MQFIPIECKGEKILIYHLDYCMVMCSGQMVERLKHNLKKREDEGKALLTNFKQTHKCRPLEVLMLTLML